MKKLNFQEVAKRQEVEYNNKFQNPNYKIINYLKRVGVIKLKNKKKSIRTK